MKEVWRKKVMALSFEVSLTLGFVAFTVLLSLVLNLPIVFPSGRSASFVGVHYLYPLFGIAVWALLLTLHGKQPLRRTFLVALPCYAVILFCHFNLKLWISHVNPVIWDVEYWAIDQAFRPLVTGSMWLRLAVAPVIPLDSNFYMIGFIIMFYLAFAYQAMQSQLSFREMIIAVMLLQVIGSIAYFAAPAVGPFLYEPGVEPPANASQVRMYDAWLANRADGAAWLAANGGSQFTAGIAAMPSLHAGGSFLFAILAWRHARRLLWVMAPIFAFIIITAIANRWHYLIDIPMGMALAFVAAALARRIVATAYEREKSIEEASGVPVLTIDNATPHGDALARS